MRTTVGDLSAFVGMWAAGGEWNGTRILGEKSVAAALPPPVEGIGHVWARYEMPFGSFVGHYGGDPGVATAALFDPDENIAVVMLTNRSWRNSPAYDELLAALVREAEATRGSR
ncbi:MAG: serine hydrolase [Spirochaetota bacterium]